MLICNDFSHKIWVDMKKMSADITISPIIFSNFYIVINETHQDVSIDDVIKSTYVACKKLEFVDKDYKGAKSVGDKPKSGKAKEKPAKTPKLFELLKRQFPGEPEKVGRIMGTLKREDLEKMLVDGKDDDIEFVKAKIQEAQKLRDAGMKAHESGDHVNSEKLLNQALELFKRIKYIIEIFL